MDGFALKNIRSIPRRCHGASGGRDPRGAVECSRPSALESVWVAAAFSLALSGGVLTGVATAQTMRTRKHVIRSREMNFPEVL